MKEFIKRHWLVWAMAGVVSATIAMSLHACNNRLSTDDTLQPTKKCEPSHKENSRYEEFSL